MDCNVLLIRRLWVRVPPPEPGYPAGGESSSACRSRRCALSSSCVANVSPHTWQTPTSPSPAWFSRSDISFRPLRAPPQEVQRGQHDHDEHDDPDDPDPSDTSKHP